MSRTLLIKIGLLVCLALNVFLVHSQVVSETQRLRIYMRNSSIVYKGTLLFDDGKEMKFMTDEIGPLILKKEQLRRLEVIKPEVKKNVERGFLNLNDESPFSTRYNFTTNAFPIKKGSNYAMFSLYGPEIHIALNDRLNVGYMTTWAISPMALTAKYSFKSKREKLHFGLGTLLLSSGHTQSGKGYGTLTYGCMTLGKRDKNITLSAGYIYWQGGAKKINPGYYTTEFMSRNELSTYDNVPLRLRENDYGYRAINSTFVADSNLSNGYLTRGIVIGLNGTMPIGGNAHFVFETAYSQCNGSREAIVRTEHRTEPANAEGTWFNKYNVYKVTVEPYQSKVVMFSPGIRFQSTENFAWQCSVSGIYIKNSHDRIGKGLPLPMITLFKKL